MARQIGGARARAEYLGLRALRAVLCKLPLGAAVRTGAAVGRLTMALDLRNRPVATRNLEIAFPGARRDARGVILLGMYRNLGRMAAEWAHFRDINSANVTQIAAYDGECNWRAAQGMSAGRGILVLTGHFGNFELLSLAHSAYGNRVAIVQRPLRNPLIAADVNAARVRLGNRVIARKGAGRQIIRALRDNWMVGIPIDLDVRRGVFVDFFSLKACTTDSLARLAMASGAPVLPAFMVRQGSSERHHITFLPPVELVRGNSREIAVRENTQRFTGIFERMVKRYPDHWNWIHRRWKTRPPGEERFY